MRSNVYQDIISIFEMPNKPNNGFDPNCKDFTELVKWALSKAFNDFNFRTLTKTSNFAKEYKAWEEEINTKRKHQRKNKEKVDTEPKMTDYLILRLEKYGFLERFAAYFSIAPLSQNSFDVWHNQTCNMFLNILNATDEYQNELKVYKELAYGKAQKIVNMMFKHLYCLEGAEAYEAHFEHCHMTLDNFTLEWFKKTLDEKRIESWSNLIYEEYPKDHNDYLFYQEKIRNYFLPKDTKTHTYAGLTPFQAEFYIWPEIQWLMGAMSLLNQSLPKEVARSNQKIVKDESVVMLCDDLICRLNELKRHYE